MSRLRLTYQTVLPDTPGANEGLLCLDAYGNFGVKRADGTVQGLAGAGVLTLQGSGTAALLGINNQFAAPQSMPALATGITPSILDDNVYAFTPAQTQGMLVLWSKQGGTGPPQRNAIFAYRAVTTAHCVVIAQPSTVFETAAVALLGTTGTDGKATVAAASDGKIYIENRLGGNGQWGYVLLG